MNTVHYEIFVDNGAYGSDVVTKYTEKEALAEAEKWSADVKPKDVYVTKVETTVVAVVNNGKKVER